MTRLEFEQLTDSEQMKTLRTFGVFLAERVVHGNRLYLYALSSFYIELFHELSCMNNSGIRVFRIFENTDYLDAYLTRVDISRLQ